MKKVSFLVVIILFMSYLSHAKENVLFSASLYGTPLFYNSSKIKDKGYSTGIYGYVGVGLKHSIEFDFERTKIDYKDGSTLNQNDITAIYTFYPAYGFKIKGGFHYIISDDKLTDKGKVFILGAEKYSIYRWNAGIEGTVSLYQDYSPELTVYQISPYGGFYFGKYYKYGSFYTSLKGYFIKLSKDIGLGKNFNSVELNLSYFYKSFTGRVFGWFGKQSFAVRNGGFVVFNLSEKHKGGYGTSLSYRYKKLNTTLTAFKEIFEDIGYKNNASLTVILVNIGYTF